jgi:hypothetical protein
MNAPKSELDLARAALAAAHDRFRQDAAKQAAKQDVVAWYASLGETLWWIVALDEHYRNRNSSTYVELLESDEDGRVIPALRLARNRIGHGLSLMLEDPDGHSPFSAPPLPARLTLKTLQWRRLEDLPPVSPRTAKREEKMRPVYQDHLAGNPVRFGLRRASHFFIQRRSVLDSAIRLGSCLCR